MVQRTLSAKNLTNAQGGALFASALKVLPLFFMIVPGMFARILFPEEIAPSQPREPLALSDSPEYPFQRICTDYFEIGSHAYLSIVDRFTGWIIVYHYPEHARSEQLI